MRRGRGETSHRGSKKEGNKSIKRLSDECVGLIIVGGREWVPPKLRAANYIAFKINY